MRAASCAKLVLAHERDWSESIGSLPLSGLIMAGRFWDGDDNSINQAERKLTVTPDSVEQFEVRYLYGKSESLERRSSLWDVSAIEEEEEKEEESLKPRDPARSVPRSLSKANVEGDVG